MEFTGTGLIICGLTSDAIIHSDLHATILCFLNILHPNLFALNARITTYFALIFTFNMHDVYNRAYSDAAGGSNTCSEQAMFEANPLDVCIPMEWEGKTHSVIFGEENKEPTATYYDLTSDCTGIPIDAALSTECQAVVQNDAYSLSSQISFTWEYFHSDGTDSVVDRGSDSNPSSAPTVATAKLTLHPST